MEGQIPATPQTAIIYPVFSPQNTGLFVNTGEHSGHLIYVPRKPMPWNPTQKHVFVQPPALYQIPMPRHQTQPIVWQPAVNPQMIVSRPMTFISRHSNPGSFTVPTAQSALNAQNVIGSQAMYSDIQRAQLNPVRLPSRSIHNLQIPKVVLNTRQVAPDQVSNNCTQSSNQAPLVTQSESKPGQDLNKAQGLQSDIQRKQLNLMGSQSHHNVQTPNAVNNTSQVAPSQGPLTAQSESNPGQDLNTAQGLQSDILRTQLNLVRSQSHHNVQTSNVVYPHNQYVHQYKAGRSLGRPPGAHSAKNRVQTKKATKINNKVKIPPTAATKKKVPSLKPIPSKINAQPNVVEPLQSIAHANLSNNTAPIQAVDNSATVQASEASNPTKGEESVDLNTLQGPVAVEESDVVIKTEPLNLPTVSTALNDTATKIESEETTMLKEQLVETNETTPRKQAASDSTMSICVSQDKDETAIDINITEMHIDDSNTNTKFNTDMLVCPDEEESETNSINQAISENNNRNSKCDSDEAKICDTSNCDGAKGYVRNSDTPNLIKYRSQHGNLFFNDDIPDDYILTHVIEGFVLQESKRPFPIKRLPLREKLPINEAPTLKRFSHTPKSVVTVSPANCRRKEKPAPKRGKLVVEIVDDPIRLSEARNLRTRLAAVKQKINNDSLVVKIKVEHLADEDDTEMAERSDTESSHDYSGYPFASYDAKTVQMWSVIDLAVRVSEIGWDQTAMVLQEQEVDGRALFLASMEDLTKAGIEMDQAAAICSYTLTHSRDVDEYGNNQIVRHILNL